MKMKKCLALALSASMMVGMSMTTTSLAADPTTSATMPIYSLDVLNVIVPTKFSVAFNPEGLPVKTGGSSSSTDNVLSKKYAIINKSNFAKDVSVSFAVTDSNTTGQKITFKDAAGSVGNTTDKYDVYLKVTPSSDLGLKNADGNLDSDKLIALTATTASDTDFTAATGKDKTLTPGKNVMNFCLKEATYDVISGKEPTLGTTLTNNVTANYKLTTMAATNAVGFSFGGAINTNADWTKVAKGVGITATYHYVTALKAHDSSIVSGTVLMTPRLTASSTTAKTFEYAEADIASIEKVEIVKDDGTVINAKLETAPTAAGNPAKVTYTMTATVGDTDVAGSTIKTIVTYTDAKGNQQTEQVDVKKAI